MISLTSPHVSEKSRSYVVEALESHHQQGDGHFCHKASAALTKLLNEQNLVLTPSCTSSLEMASLLLDLKPGDEVLMPSFNFTSAAIAVAKFGAIPVFLDIEPETLCLETSGIEKAITNKTKAISWVNYAGFTPNLSFLREVSESKKLALIEDNAHCLGTKFKGELLGKTGDFVAYSFHATKNIQCGEGGALTMKSAEMYSRAQKIREKGTNRNEFLSGLVDKYSWVDLGSSYLLSEVQAALLLGNIEDFNSIQAKRLELYEKYCENFRSFADSFAIDGSFESPEPGFSAHLFFFLVPSERMRDELIHFLRNKGFVATFHYQALHESKAAAKYGKKVGNLKMSDEVSKRIIRLPLHTKMTLTDVDKISEAVNAFFMIHN